MESYSGRILVEDASGSRFYVHEYRGRGLLRPVRRYVLDTGEEVRRVDRHKFLIVATGEPLLRAAEE